MDNREEIKAFLTSRRAKITPDEAGLTNYSRNRRVTGLRRSEVADLAGVSVEYYAQLERGNLKGVSDSVLDALARALHLDDAEREHLLHLAHAAGPALRTRRRSPTAQVRPAVLRILDGMTEVPAFVQNGRLEILAANALALALYDPVFTDTTGPANLARFNFLNPQAQTFWGDPERAANDTVAMLRTEAGRDPYDKSLTDLVGELSTRSGDFRTRWAAHNVQLHRTGTKDIHHPIVGDLHLSYEVMELPADPGLTLVAFSAEPESATHEALRFLASWTTEQHATSTTTTT